MDQVGLIQEERKLLLLENEALHLEIQEMIAEIQFLKQDSLSMNILMGNPKNPNVSMQKMHQRIEELEDIILELKQKGKRSFLFEF